jgi:hypothetical protein
MVGDLRGHAAVSIQVKTSNWAWRERKRKPEDSHWEWDVGFKSMELKGDSIFYAFVDLRWEKGKRNEPAIFIVPSAVVANHVKPNFSRAMFWFYVREKEKYYERWDRILERLAPPASVKSAQG